jgi:hypothetical protein
MRDLSDVAAVDVHREERSWKRRRSVLVVDEHDVLSVRRWREERASIAFDAFHPRP